MSDKVKNNDLCSIYEQIKNGEPNTDYTLHSSTTEDNDIIIVYQGDSVKCPFTKLSKKYLVELGLITESKEKYFIPSPRGKVPEWRNVGTVLFSELENFANLSRDSIKYNDILEFLVSLQKEFNDQKEKINEIIEKLEIANNEGKIKSALKSIFQMLKDIGVDVASSTIAHHLNT